MEVGMEHVVKQMKRAIADAEGLLETGRDQLGEARGTLTARIGQARERLTDLEREAVRRGRVVAGEAARYAHEHPWQVTGVGVGAAIAIGIAVGLALGSRKH